MPEKPDHDRVALERDEWAADMQLLDSDAQSELKRVRRLAQLHAALASLNLSAAGSVELKSHTARAIQVLQVRFDVN